MLRRPWSKARETGARGVTLRLPSASCADRASVRTGTAPGSFPASRPGEPANAYFADATQALLNDRRSLAAVPPDPLAASLDPRPAVGHACSQASAPRRGYL